MRKQFIAVAGWPDWANFRLWGEYFLWVDIFLENGRSTNVAKLWGYIFPS
jgi:hypothetical protein